MEPYDPKFGNPYPDTDWNDITSFKYLTPLHLYREISAVKMRDGEDADYLLGQEYKVAYALDNGPLLELTVPKGLLTDLTSTPSITRSLVSRVGPHLEAAIVHDFLYIAWQLIPGRGAQKRDWDFADKLMRAAMKEAKVSFTKRLLISSALKVFGWPIYRSKNEPPYFVDF